MGKAGQRGKKEPDEAPEDIRARKLVEEVVPQHIEQWAAAIGLRRADAPFEQFREGVTEALHACMRAHIADKHSLYKRFSDLRKDFLALDRAATGAAVRLRSVEDLLRRLPPMQHDPAFRLIHDPHAAAFELDNLAERARSIADECKRADPGGTLILRSFEAFAKGLVHAYQSATGRTGVGRGAREGELRNLCDAVLPIACEIAETVTGKPLEVSDDPGEYLHRIATQLRGT
jgi:hypothetical protein